jgi:hypothetical protein
MGQTIGFDAKVRVDPDAELRAEAGLARAIATAAQEAATTLSEVQTFEVTRIFITVEPNPGPTAYKVFIKPVG